MKISLKSGVSEKSCLTLVFEQKNRSDTSFGVEKTYIGVFKIIRCIKLYRLSVKIEKFFDKIFKNSAKNVKSIDAISLKRWHYFFLK